jgi:tRNA pseudouridine55 synthase
MNDGIVLINKPVGLTSFAVVKKTGKNLKAKKVGHCGTLDPFATGLLVITINNATKIARFIEAKNKEYIATLKLGIKTDSGDSTGKVIKRQKPPKFEIIQLNDVLKSFLGKQLQIPPMYSAIKVDGQKLYELARKGKTIELTPRPIEIFEIKLLKYRGNNLTFSVKCSKGTYIRSLGEDLAKRLGCVGHLSALERTAIGELKLDDAKKMDSIKETDIIPIAEALKSMSKYIVPKDKYSLIKNGSTISLAPDYDDEFILMIDEQSKPLAIYEKSGEDYRCLRGLTI